MPFMTDTRYEAIRFYLESVRDGLTTRAIDWANQSLEDYAQEKFGSTYSGSHESNSKAAIDQKKKRKNVLVTTAKAFALNTTASFKTYPLSKLNKPVPKPSQYEGLLQELHDGAGHVGTNKLKLVVSFLSKL